MTCEKCKQPMPLKIVDSTVAVGNGTRTDSHATRYCEACVGEFMADLRRDVPPLAAMGAVFQEELARVDVEVRRAS